MEQTEKKNKPLEYLIIIVGTLFSLFYIYEAVFGIWTTYSHRASYLLFTGVLIFLVYPGRSEDKDKKHKVSRVDMLLIGATILSVSYWMYSFMDRALVRFGEPNQLDLIFNLILIFLCFEMARRVLGYILPALTLILVLYCYLGRYIPGYWGHKGFSITRIIEYMGTMESIFGFAINAYATYVFLFIVFSAFLEATGAGTFLIDFANSLAGKFKGGAANRHRIQSNTGTVSPALPLRGG